MLDNLMTGLALMASAEKMCIRDSIYTVSICTVGFGKRQEQRCQGIFHRCCCTFIAQFTRPFVQWLNQCHVRQHAAEQLTVILFRDSWQIFCRIFQKRINCVYIRFRAAERCV